MFCKLKNHDFSHIKGKLKKTTIKGTLDSRRVKTKIKRMKTTVSKLRKPCRKFHFDIKKTKYKVLKIIVKVKVDM